MVELLTHKLIPIIIITSIHSLSIKNRKINNKKEKIKKIDI